jgi:two-component system cell cycle response regulator
MTRHSAAERRAATAAIPAALAVLIVVLVCGAFGGQRLWPWVLLIATGLVALGRFARAGRMSPAQSIECGLLAGVAALALTDVSRGLASPLLYLLGAGYVLALPVTRGVPLIGAMLGLDLGMTLARGAPLVVPGAHAGFTILFAALYHALLGARLAAARKAEGEAVKKRIAEAEQSARELRLVATADEGADRHLLAGVAEVEEVLRGTLAVAEAALKPHAVAIFLLSPDGESLRLRECLSQDDGLFRGPLSSKEGALGAVVSAGRPVRLAGDGPALSYYEGAPRVSSFCGVALAERGDGPVLGALIADRKAEFSSDDERVMVALAAEAVRAIEAERLLGAVRREKEEKARFFKALEELNRTTTLSQAAETAVQQARRMCPALDLCAVTLGETVAGRARHRVLAVDGDAAQALRDLTFADNAGLVSNVVKLGAPLPGRALGAMDRVVIFDNATVVRGLAALKVFPLRAGQDTVGALVCGSRSRDALGESSQKELSMLALQAAEALVRTRLYEQTEKLATTDGLTGLLNRRTLNAQLLARLREAQRYQRPIAFLLLDVDHFKKVNDTYGHPAGDAVLKGVARVAQRQARETDLVARYGGEEMALVLPETDLRGALAIAERVRAACAAAPHATEQGPVKVTLSVGVSSWQPGAPAVTPEELLENADRALYRAKQGGRNRVEGPRTKAAA